MVELLDANGAAFADYHYDAWGLPTATTTQATTLITASLAANIASRQVLRYASYAYDSESGLYYCSARYYDPATRQFTTADSAKADGEESAYQYCGGAPVGGVDLDGRRQVRCNVYENGDSTQSIIAIGWVDYRQNTGSTGGWYVDAFLVANKKGGKLTITGWVQDYDDGDVYAHHSFSKVKSTAAYTWKHSPWASTNSAAHFRADGWNSAWVQLT